MESTSSIAPAGRISTAARCPSLPAEVWGMIFSVGHDDEDGGFWSCFRFPHLASICRSCTLFRDLVRPRLYYRFHSHLLTQIYSFNDKEYERFSVAKFARTISTNPHLASMVRRVDIQGVCDKWDVVPEAPVPLGYYPDDPMASVLTRKAVELGMVLRYYDVYTNVHSPQNVGFDLVALILVQLPMLDTLDLKWSGTPPMTRIPQPRSFWPWKKSIRNMTLTYSSIADPTKDDIIRDQRLIPGDCLKPVRSLISTGTSLTRLTLMDCAGPNLVLPLENLREAFIIDCQFRPGQFLNLLKPCKALVKFVTRGTVLSHGPEIIEALEPASSGLEVLGLDFVGRNSPRILSFTHFTALKTLYLDMRCVWNRQVLKNSPPNPDMLLTTLLPESIEEVAIFNEGVDEQFGFEFEAHAKRLALERNVNGRFQHLRWLHGVSFSAIDENMESDMEQAMEDGDPDEAREILTHVSRRLATLAQAKKLMGDGGVEFSLDLIGVEDSYFSIDYLIWGLNI
ncbi:hypothetical protein DHEL01_v209682 [Diaporthe helianthi]|uniref:Uncharacterized protein n=1 Tax=Diaporthe helianthi TaxID=158607 RepID=A0A2P5HNU2_DIAHE|nr:hypothetical protein DHEL01_v209682 [Diaporthe helianthi]